MRLSRRISAVFLGLAFVFACSKGDPDQASTWIPQLENKDTRKRFQALDNLTRIKDPAAVSAILPLLKEEGEVQVRAAKALKEIAQPSSVSDLVAAIDFEVGVGVDPALKALNNANKEIAKLLGSLGDKSAVDSLIRLAERSRDPYVRVEAVNALGELGDTKAVPVLMKIATNEDEETYVNKKAIQALGNIGDPAAVPAIKKMLFHERKGISFYMEASYAAYQIGQAAAEPLLAVLEAKDEELHKWADENDIYREALYAKAAQVLADLGERRAIPTLVRYLNYTRPGSGDAMDVTNLIVRRQAADALGRLRAREAVMPLTRGLSEDEGNVRKVYADALVAIGDRRALPALVACALKGEVMDKSAHARKGCYIALSRLGDESSLAQWEKWEQAEPSLTSTACMRGLVWDNEAQRAQAQEHCDTMAQNVIKILQENKSRLLAYKECKEDVDCWIGKLADEDAKVRERAAMELGRIGDPKAVAPLMAALNDRDLEARAAAIMATDHIASASKEALEEAKKGLEKLDQQIAEEQDKVHFARVNEDLKRLAVKIRRLDRIGG